MRVSMQHQPMPKRPQGTPVPLSMSFTAFSAPISIRPSIISIAII